MGREHQHQLGQENAHGHGIQHAEPCRDLLLAVWPWVPRLLRAARARETGVAPLSVPDGWAFRLTKEDMLRNEDFAVQESTAAKLYKSDCIKHVAQEFLSEYTAEDWKPAGIQADYRAVAAVHSLLQISPAFQFVEHLWMCCLLQLGKVFCRKSDGQCFLSLGSQDSMAWGWQLQVVQGTARSQYLRVGPVTSDPDRSVRSLQPLLCIGLEGAAANVDGVPVKW